MTHDLWCSIFSVDFLLQSSLRISPPLPFLPLSGVSRDPLKMGVGSRLDQDQAALATVTSSPAGASKRWPGASAWPSWDLLDSPEDPFSIEREARLHRQAAGKSDGGSQQASVSGDGPPGRAPWGRSAEREFAADQAFPCAQASPLGSTCGRRTGQAGRAARGWSCPALSGACACSSCE